MSDSDNDCVLATLRLKIKPTSGSSEASDINEEETVTAANKRKIINQGIGQRKSLTMKIQSTLVLRTRNPLKHSNHQYFASNNSLTMN